MCTLSLARSLSHQKKKKKLFKKAIKIFKNIRESVEHRAAAAKPRICRVCAVYAVKDLAYQRGWLGSGDFFPLTPSLLLVLFFSSLFRLDLFHPPILAFASDIKSVRDLLHERSCVYLCIIIILTVPVAFAVICTRIVIAAPHARCLHRYHVVVLSCKLDVSCCCCCRICCT